jgi:thiol-disulfide isomerase/thioredoxin
MQAVAIGPVVFAGDRLAAIVGIGVFMVASSLLSPRLAPRVGRWSTWAILGGLAAARLGHIIENAASFTEEPWRSLAVWQGGFSWPWGVVAVAAMGTVFLRTRRDAMAGGVALGLALFSWNVASRLATETRPIPLPRLILRTSAGEEATLSSFSGHPTVLNLWASWCPPSRREMPMMAQIAAERQDVTFVFVNQGEGGAAVEQYINSQRLAMRHVLLDPGAQVARHYEMPGLPVTLFIGSDGRLRSTHVGEISREALAAALRSLGQR